MLIKNQVVLREFREADLPFLAQTRNDLEIETAAHPGPPHPQQADVFSKRLRAGHTALSSGGPDSVEFVICRAADSDRPIGVGGLYSIDRHNRISEFGVTIGDRGSWRGGFGFDAHLALMDYAFDTLGLRKLYGQVKSDNRAVLRLCERLGMTREGVLRGHRWRSGRFVDLVVFGIFADEYDRSLANWRAHGGVKNPGAVRAIHRPSPSSPDPRST